jgi:4-hydroxybenzoate polyprenyltransferase
VFTIWAEVLLGWLIAGGVPDLKRSPPTTWPERSWETRPGEWHVLVNLIPLGCLLAAATCFHAAGIVWANFLAGYGNPGEKPEQPTASGGGRRFPAGCLAAALVGLGFGFIVVCMTWDVFRPAAVAVTLVLYMLFADRIEVPRPLAVGICDFLHVLLGCSTSRFYVPGYPQVYYFIALIVGISAAGVTCCAPAEAPRSPRWRLCGAAGVLLTAAVLAQLLPAHRRALSHGLFRPFEPQGIPTDGLEMALYPYLILLWSVIIAIPVYRALREPSPPRVQVAGRIGLLGLIGLDALLAFAVVGWPGLLILILLIPALVFGTSADSL